MEGWDAGDGLRMGRKAVEEGGRGGRTMTSHVQGSKILGEI